MWRVTEPENPGVDNPEGSHRGGRLNLLALGDALTPLTLHVYQGRETQIRGNTLAGKAVDLSAVSNGVNSNGACLNLGVKNSDTVRTDHTPHLVDPSSTTSQHDVIVHYLRQLLDSEIKAINASHHISLLTEHLCNGVGPTQLFNATLTQLADIPFCVPFCNSPEFQDDVTYVAHKTTLMLSKLLIYHWEKQKAELDRIRSINAETTSKVLLETTATDPQLKRFAIEEDQFVRKKVQCIKESKVQIRKHKLTESRHSQLHIRNVHSQFKGFHQFLTKRASCQTAQHTPTTTAPLAPISASRAGPIGAQGKTLGMRLNTFQLSKSKKFELGSTSRPTQAMFPPKGADRTEPITPTNPTSGTIKVAPPTGAKHFRNWSVMENEMSENSSKPHVNPLECIPLNRESDLLLSPNIFNDSSIETPSNVNSSPVHTYKCRVEPPWTSTPPLNSRSQGEHVVYRSPKRSQLKNRRATPYPVMNLSSPTKTACLDFSVDNLGIYASDTDSDLIPSTSTPIKGKTPIQPMSVNCKLDLQKSFLTDDSDLNVIPPTEGATKLQGGTRFFGNFISDTRTDRIELSNSLPDTSTMVKLLLENMSHSANSDISNSISTPKTQISHHQLGPIEISDSTNIGQINNLPVDDVSKISISEIITPGACFDNGTTLPTGTGPDPPRDSEPDTQPSINGSNLPDPFGIPRDVLEAAINALKSANH